MSEDKCAARYPDYFPNNCPPQNAVAHKKTLFRFCKNAEPVESDFESYYLKKPEKYKDKINAYGLSVLGSKEDCSSAVRKSPYLRVEYISFGDTDENIGCYLNTPNKKNPGHITWWVCEGIKPHTFFKVCAKGGEVSE